MLHALCESIREGLYVWAVLVLRVGYHLIDLFHFERFKCKFQNLEQSFRLVSYIVYFRY